jgi:glyoxalase family protein
MRSAGIHHITAMAGDPQLNLDFYTETLGLRLVKRTVNFDDPGSYHFYFGDNFFSMARRATRRPRERTGDDRKLRDSQQFNRMVEKTIAGEPRCRRGNQ